MMFALAKMRRSRSPLIPFALCAGLAGPAALLRPARGAEPIQGLRSLAMGGALRGAASGAEGTLLNPSGIAYLRQYAVSGFYSFGIQELSHSVHVSVADSVTQRRVAMGLYYNFINSSPPVSLNVAEAEMPGARIVSIRDIRLSRQGHEIGLLSAFPLGDRFILGLTTKYGYFSTSAQLPLDQLPPDFAPTNPRIDKDKVYDMGSVSNVVSFDIGLTIRALDRLSIGLVGQNLWGHGTEMPTTLGAGLAFQFSQRLTVAADVLLNFTGYQTCEGTAEKDPCNTRQDPAQPTPSNRTVVRAGGGVEYVIADKVPLRAGYMFDSLQNSSHISAGLGYQSPRFGIDAALRQRLAGGNETILLLGFRIFRD